jgi:octaprenyl-diphosphate synthase
MTSQAAGITLDTLQAGLRPRLEVVRGELARIIASDFPLIAEVNGHLQQMRGKMFRPTLLLLSEEASGARDERAEILAAVIELIHLATLVHDDSVDHSALRRGMPTINALFSHQVSVIMGDYLYSRAVVELTELGDIAPLRVLARVTNEMTVGEMRQLMAHDPLNFSESEYELLIRSKTASLLAGACEIGAIRAAPRERAALREYGDRLGMVFQIVDDLLDYTGAEAVTGKPTGKDLREHKMTLPLIYTLGRLTPAARKVVAALMASSEPSDQQVGAVIGMVAEHGGLDYARAKAQALAEQADAALEALDPSSARERLRESILYVLERRS